LVQKLVEYMTPQVGKVLPSAYATSVGPALQLIVFGLVVMAFLLIEPRGIQHRVEKIKLYYRLRPFSY
jgi:branched-chain amino acid transport system permease protein